MPMDYLKSGKIYRDLANFIYFSHPLFLSLLIGLTHLKELLLFISTTILSIITGYIIIKSNNKILLLLLK